MNLISNKTMAMVTQSKAILFYCIVSFFLFFEMAIQVSPSVMATPLMHDMQIGTFGLGIMSSVYFYTYAGMQIPSGILFDRFNPRLIITFSILTCAIGTLCFSFATNIYMGSLARMLMGLGSAFAFVSVLVVTADLFKSRYFATITGGTQMLAALGAMSGQMPISLLTQQVGWRHTLLFLAIVGFVLTFIVWKSLRYEKKKTKLTREPILTNLKFILGSSQTWLIALYSCLMWAPMSSFASLWGVPFIRHVKNYSSSESAFLCSLMWLGLAFASPVLGWLSTTAKSRVYPLAISALIGVISFSLVLQFNFMPSVMGLLLFLAGSACAGQALSFTLVKENNPLTLKGTAIAFNNMAVVISGAFLQPIIGKIIGGKPGAYDITNFTNGLYLILGCYVLAFIISFFFIKEPVITIADEKNIEKDNFYAHQKELV